MLCHVAQVLAVAATILCLAASGARERSADQRSHVRLLRLSCKAAQDVKFSHFLRHEPGDRTSKSVLQVLIKDYYNVTLLPPVPTTPPPLPPTQSPTLPSPPFIPIPQTSLKTFPSLSSAITTPPPPTTTTARPRTTTKSSRAETTISTTSSFASFVESAERDDDWDYIEGLVPDSKEDKILLAYERARHQIRTLMRESEKNKKDMQLFCNEAAKEDAGVIESDGSLHPLYEMVPGVGIYRLHARARSWEAARKVCEREGAQLAVPNSREEALALMDIHNRCPRLLDTHFNEYQYLGVHDLYSEGDWETVVGYPLNETGYVNWAKNQPDNSHHHGENCLSMNRSGFYNDVPCWVELPFICEHP